MNLENKVIEIMKKNNGMITTKQINENGIARVIMTRLVNKGLIIREKHGLYILKGELGDEYYTLIYNIPQATFSHLTSLYFLNLSERVPLTYDITVSTKYRGRLETNNFVNLHKVNEDILEIGRIKIKSPQGQEIYIYDVERSLCDLIKDKKNIDFELLKKAFVTYYRIDKNDTLKIYQYANKLGVEKEVNEFMEVLL